MPQTEKKPRVPVVGGGQRRGVAGHSEPEHSVGGESRCRRMNRRSFAPCGAYLENGRPASLLGGVPVASRLFRPERTAPRRGDSPVGSLEAKCKPGHDRRCQRTSHPEEPVDTKCPGDEGSRRPIYRSETLRSLWSLRVTMRRPVVAWKQTPDSPPWRCPAGAWHRRMTCSLSSRTDQGVRS